jgi:hypothetical protein
MSIFDDIGGFFEDSILEPLAQDAIPLAAAYATGGQSLQFLPPTNSIGSVLDIAGVKPPQKQVRTPQPKAAAQLVQSPNTTSINTASQAAPAQVAANAPQVLGSDSFFSGNNNLLIFGGLGVVGLIVLIFAMTKGKK